MFQTHHSRKSTKFLCKVCGENQSILRIFTTGSVVKCRKTVERLNSSCPDADSDEVNEELEKYEDEQHRKKCFRHHEMRIETNGNNPRDHHNHNGHHNGTNGDAVNGSHEKGSGDHNHNSQDGHNNHADGDESDNGIYGDQIEENLIPYHLAQDPSEDDNHNDSGTSGNNMCSDEGFHEDFAHDPSGHKRPSSVPLDYSTGHHNDINGSNSRNSHDNHNHFLMDHMSDDEQQPCTSKFHKSNHNDHSSHSINQSSISSTFCQTSSSSSSTSELIDDEHFSNINHHESNSNSSINESPKAKRCKFSLF